MTQAAQHYSALHPETKGRLVSLDQCHRRNPSVTRELWAFEIKSVRKKSISKYREKSHHETYRRKRRCKLLLGR
jgi:hypothetical protein